MVNLYDVISESDLRRAVDDDLVNTQIHPDLSLRIYNYTAKAQYTDGAWNNPAVRMCRGLIVNNDDKIIARPFPKFFNYGDSNAPAIEMHEPVRVGDKLDGSLGILYSVDGSQHAIATRGSFTSDQALHATKVWLQRYQGLLDPPEGETWLFEIIYPKNRIVVNYGNMDDLVLLACVDNKTGRPRPAATDDWSGPCAQMLPHSTLAEALNATPRSNAEGMVIYVLDSDEMLKIKQEDYVRLHRIVTGLSEKVVWEHLSQDGHVHDLLDNLPDEFHEWVSGVADRLKAEHSGIHTRATAEFSAVVFSVTGDESRKAFALRAKASEDAALLFMLYDGRSIDEAIWKRLKPVGDTRIFAQSEDVA